jgi:predicted enzyme related to lactoylglutathione lyase
MSQAHGKFIWLELMTTDRLAAASFYSHVVGWSPMEMPAYGYTLFEALRPDGAGRTGVAGMMPIPPDLQAINVQPNWTPYIGVSDCDSTVSAIEAKGGRIRRPAEDIPGIGRFAVVADPHGAVFCIMTPVEMDAPPPEMPARAPGGIGWYELMADDADAAFTFYSAVFGWTIAEDMPLGDPSLGDPSLGDPSLGETADAGVYRIFAQDGRPTGGMMTRPDTVPVPHWAAYITVDGLQAAVARIGEAGGSIVYGPAEVPGPAYIVNAIDPQGAPFALVADRL